MSKRDYYEILGLKKDATDSEIKKAYRKLAKELHPDKGGDENAFKEVTEAYEHLSDKDKKSRYDRFGHSDSNGYNQNNSDMFSRFYDIFGQHFNNKQVRNGEDISLIVKLTLEEIYTGVKKTYNYNRNAKCTDCDGHGGTDGHECPDCNGSGIRMQVFQTPMGYMQQQHQCGRCNGVGTIFANECKTCNGKGVKNTKETIEIDIPTGVFDGNTFVMQGKGQGIKGGNEGDLHIKIMELPHKTFTRSGSDLKMNLKLKYHQLVLGDKVEIDTIEGTKIRIKVPEYSDVNTNLKIPFKGITQLGKEGRGDLIITLGIDMPKELTDDQKEAVIDLKHKVEIINQK